MGIHDIFGGALSCSDQAQEAKNALRNSWFLSLARKVRITGTVRAAHPSMQLVFHSKRILKPDVAPPRQSESFEKLGHGLMMGAIGFCCVAGAVALVLFIV